MQKIVYLRMQDVGVEIIVAGSGRSVERARVKVEQVWNLCNRSDNYLLEVRV